MKECEMHKKKNNRKLTDNDMHSYELHQITFFYVYFYHMYG